jgi:lipid-A-disaccharide synthase
VVLGRPVFPELLQDEVRAEALVRAVQANQRQRPELEAAITELRSRMGAPGASLRAAEDLLKLLDAGPQFPASPTRRLRLR